jgi:hypothetical protein
VLGQKPGGPRSTSVNPNPITASGDVQALMIVGSNLAGVTKLHLEKPTEADIPADTVKATETSLSAQIKIPKGKTGDWDVVVNDGAHAATIGTVGIAPPAAVPKVQSPEVAASAQPDGELSPPELTVVNLAVPATINTGFLGHGMFLEYAPITTLQRYAKYKGNASGTTELVERFIQALQDMHVASVWVQLFSASGVLDRDGKGGTLELVEGLKQANIACVGWGYCYSDNAATDPGLAKHLCEQYGITAFIADVEPGNTVHGNPDTWQPAAFKNLIAALKGTFGKDNLGISTFGNLKLHQDAASIYKLAIDDVALFAPQIYWYKKAPVAYAQDCIASFRQAGIGNPLVGTVQAYWELGNGVSRELMEGKVKDFAGGFADWGKLVGLNWYHGGNANTDASGAMSDPMIDVIVASRLDQKPYAAPSAAGSVGV